MDVEQIEIKENGNKKPKKKRKIIIDILIYAVIIAAILLLVLPKYFELKINIEAKEDIAFAKELNANLTESGSIETIDDLKEVLKKYGYVFEDIEASIDNCYFVWESETNQIMFVEKMAFLYSKKAWFYLISEPIFYCKNKHSIMQKNVKSL